MANTKKTTTTKNLSTKKEEKIETPKVVDEVNDEVMDPEETINTGTPEVPDTNETEVPEEKTSISAEELKTVDLDEFKNDGMNEDLIPAAKETPAAEQRQDVIKATPLFPKSKYTQSMIVKKYN